MLLLFDLNKIFQFRFHILKDKWETFNPISTGVGGGGGFHRAVTFLLINPKILACWEVSKLSGKTPYKKTQLKTLITFDRVMVLTSNLVNILIMAKDICWHKHFLWWRHQKFWRAKNEKINFVIFGAPFWVKSLYS